MSDPLNDVVLAGNRYAPTASRMGFLRCSLEATAGYLAAWRRKLYGGVRVQRLRGGLERNFHRLEPLTIGRRPRELLIGTTGDEWTCYLDCGAPHGTDPVSAIGVLAQHAKTQGLAVSAIPTAPVAGLGPFGSRKFQMFGPGASNVLGSLRGIDLVQDGARWHFVLTGEPLPFEDTEAYTRRRVTDRFTGSMLEAYCRALGVDPFDLGFYSGPSVLVTSPLPERTDLEISFAETRRRIGLPPVSG